METKYCAGAVGVGVGPVAVGLVVGVGVTVGVVEPLFEHATAIAADSASSAIAAARAPGFMENRKRSRALCNNRYIPSRCCAFARIVSYVISPSTASRMTPR